MNIVVSATAQRDLEDAVAYLWDRNPDAAARLVETFYALLDRLAAGEFEGPETTLRTGRRVRSWPLHPYRVVYQLRPDGLFVVRFYHQRRKPLV